MNRRYWLLDWIDAHGVTDLVGAKRALRSKRAVSNLQARADAAEASLQAPIGVEVSLLAGRGVDFTGILDCSHPECRKKQVDRLFRRIWYYFDRVVVSELTTHMVLSHWGEGRARTELLSQIEILLYIRALGVEHLIEFREKRLPDADTETAAREAGLARVCDAGPEWVQRLAREGAIRVDASTLRRKQTKYYAIDHPLLATSLRFDIAELESEPGQNLAQRVAKASFDRYLYNLAVDIAAARYFKAPLGSVLEFYDALLDSSHQATVEQVAFNLDLPVLDGVTAATLIQIRTDEHEAFDRFRTKLRLAVTEQIKALPSASPKSIGHTIKRDMIEPELRHIKSRLKASEAALTRKTAVGIALGALATTCGLIAGAPAATAVSGGVATLASIAGSAVNKHIEERRDIQLSDLYFLWGAYRNRH